MIDTALDPCNSHRNASVLGEKNYKQICLFQYISFFVLWNLLSRACVSVYTGVVYK